MLYNECYTTNVMLLACTLTMPLGNGNENILSKQV